MKNLIFIHDIHYHNVGSLLAKTLNDYFKADVTDSSLAETRIDINGRNVIVFEEHEYDDAGTIIVDCKSTELMNAYLPPHKSLWFLLCKPTEEDVEKINNIRNSLPREDEVILVLETFDKGVFTRSEIEDFKKRIDIPVISSITYESILEGIDSGIFPGLQRVIFHEDTVISKRVGICMDMLLTITLYCLDLLDIPLWEESYLAPLISSECE